MDSAAVAFSPAGNAGPPTGSHQARGELCWGHGLGGGKASWGGPLVLLGRLGGSQPAEDQWVGKAFQAGGTACLKPQTQKRGTAWCGPELQVLEHCWSLTFSEGPESREVGGRPTPGQRLGLLRASRLTAQLISPVRSLLFSWVSQSAELLFAASFELLSVFGYFERQKTRSSPLGHS